MMWTKACKFKGTICNARTVNLSDRLGLGGECRYWTAYHVTNIVAVVHESQIGLSWAKYQAPAQPEIFSDR